MASLGRTRQAMTTLRLVLGLAAAGEVLHPFLANRPVILGLLRRLPAASRSLYVTGLINILDSDRLKAQQLTRREKQILMCLETLTVTETAHRLGISVNTVKTHLKSAYVKLGAKNARAALKAARALGVLA
jgi:LuxR family maltose regulon positive regulatory protein